MNLVDLTLIPLPVYGYSWHLSCHSCWDPTPRLSWGSSVARKQKHFYVYSVKKDLISLKKLEWRSTIFFFMKTFNITDLISFLICVVCPISSFFNMNIYKCTINYGTDKEFIRELKLFSKVLCKFLLFKSIQSFSCCKDCL